MTEKKDSNNLEWSDPSTVELNVAEWFGAVLRYCWYLGTKKFSSFYTPSEFKTNALVGWLFQIIFFLTVVLIGYRYI